MTLSDRIPVREFPAADGDDLARPIVCRAAPHTGPAIAQNRQWADFLKSLEAPRQKDPLLAHAMKFHPHFHMYLRREQERLALLQTECIRLCGGDVEHGKRLAADVIWEGVRE